MIPENKSTKSSVMKLRSRSVSQKSEKPNGRSKKNDKKNDSKSTNSPDSRKKQWTNSRVLFHEKEKSKRPFTLFPPIRDISPQQCLTPENTANIEERCITPVPIMWSTPEHVGNQNKRKTMDSYLASKRIKLDSVDGISDDTDSDGEFEIKLRDVLDEIKQNESRRKYTPQRTSGRVILKAVQYRKVKDVFK